MKNKPKQASKQTPKVENNILLDRLITTSHSTNKEMITILVEYLSELEEEINILKNK